MGTGITAWNGDKPSTANPVIYDIDAIINPASTVSALHAKGLHAIAYLEVGSIGNYYGAADEGISTTYYSQLESAGDLGGNLPGWDEKFININNPSSLSIIESMIKQQAAAKGFDAVETDLDTTFDNNDGQTPWTITESTEVEYMTAIANYCHSLGLGWIAKNLDETGNTEFIAQLEPLAQGMISEQNRQYGTYIYFTPFLNHHKWIGDAEYTLPLSSFAPQDNATNVNGVLFQQNLDGSRDPARLELRNGNTAIHRVNGCPFPAGIRTSVLVALRERGHQGILCTRLGMRVAVNDRTCPEQTELVVAAGVVGLDRPRLPSEE